MSELTDLYQEIILEHYKRPRNFGALPGANRRAEGFNPLCGDKVTLYLRMEGERVADVRFEGSGCAISTASASLLTDALKGKSAGEAEALFRDFRELLVGAPERAAELEGELGKLGALAGVREYPMRVKCATLAWHTLHAALEQQDRPVTTEGRGE
jgi:nitrogen fixation protein NifU and related proteins